MNKTLQDILPRVTKPARYTGNEYGAATAKDAAVRVCLAFPDVYEVGMSHLGSAILYSLMNSRDDTSCERVYAPWPDMADELRAAGLPLFAVESGDDVASFDLVGFSIGYEMCYTNIINMLKLAGIPLLARDRDGSFPLVYAGGGGIFDPEPVAELFDFIMIGEGEDVTNEMLDLYAKKLKKDDFLREAAKLEGIYVPAFYDVSYNDCGTVAAIVKNCDCAPDVVKKRIVRDLDAAHYPTQPLVPYVQAVHDRVMLEIFRGCTHGCRFCQAGYIYRPVREKSRETLLCQARCLIDATGCDEVSLVSLSSGDYSGIVPLLRELNDYCAPRNVSVALPSLRADTMLEAYASELKRVRKTGLTLAPEAGSQRMRDIINKNVTEDDLLGNVRSAFAAGFDTIKLYFMMGLPGETDADIDAIAELAAKVRECWYELPKEQRRRPPAITVSCSCFVPKPFTPFQYAPMADPDDVKRKQLRLKDALRSVRGVKFSYHSEDTSLLEGCFARGDRRLLPVVLRAAELGAKFDSWGEWFSMDIWRQAFADCGLDIGFYALRGREEDEVLPWSHISCGVTADYLKAEWERAQGGVTTPDCRKGCNGCGLEEVCL